MNKIMNKIYFLLSTILVLTVPAGVVSYFAKSFFLLVIMTIFLGFILGIFYKIIIFNIIPKDTFMDVGYIKFFQPMYKKFVAKSLNLLSEDSIEKFNKDIDELLKFPFIEKLIKAKIANNNKEFNYEQLLQIKDIIIKFIPNLQILGIDIKKGLGEPLTERLARAILKKEDIIHSIRNIEILLYSLVSSHNDNYNKIIDEIIKELENLKSYCNNLLLQ